MSTPLAGQIPYYTAIPSIDRGNDLLEIASVSANATYNVTPNNLMGITAGSALSTTMTQSVQNKTFDSTNTFTPSDALWTMQNSSDSTKKVNFSLSGITTGNTRTLTIPDRSSTIATLGGNQTFSGVNNFTGSSWSGGTIDSTTITVDSISGHTSSNTMTVAGVAINSGKINGSYIANSSIGPNSLATGAQSSTTAGTSTTTSTSFGNLADSVTTSVTTTIGVNGLALVILTCESTNSTTNDFCYTSFSASGANTIASSTARSITNKNSAGSSDIMMSSCFLQTGLSTGSTTFTLQYMVNAGTGTFQNRSIAVIPL